MTRDYYEILGVERGAPDLEVKAAYRKLALRFHPDRNPGDRVAEERFKELSVAYAVLSDPDKRTHYDRFGALGDAGPFAGADVTQARDFFDAMFGDLLGLGRKRSATGQDLRYTLELDFVEAALGVRKTIAFDRAEDCSACRGTGAEGGAAGLMRCERCNGEGTIRTKAGFLSSRRPCAACGGEGQLPRVRCPACEGAGLVDRRREFDVNVPPGTHSGATQRLPGQGSPGRRGGPAGDLHVIVRVRPHAIYTRQATVDPRTGKPTGGDVLLIELPISFAEATLGAEVDVPVLDGVVRMKIPPGTQSGSVFRVRGKGIPRSGGGRGDAHVNVTLETPTALGPEATALLRQLDESMAGVASPRRVVVRALVDAIAAPDTASRTGGEGARGGGDAKRTESGGG